MTDDWWTADHHIKWFSISKPNVSNYKPKSIFWIKFQSNQVITFSCLNALTPAIDLKGVPLYIWESLGFPNHIIQLCTLSIPFWWHHWYYSFLHLLAHPSKVILHHDAHFLCHSTPHSSIQMVHISFANDRSFKYPGVVPKYIPKDSVPTYLRAQ